MKILELFAGSGVFSQTARKEFKAETFTIDNNESLNPDYCGDMLNINLRRIPFVPDIIWGSPPCTGFSVAAIGHHWTGGKGAYIPKTETAKMGIELVKNTLDIITYFQKYNPNLIYYIENPRGVLRKLGILGDIPFHHTVTYCQYGDNRMKPTDIWTNNENWKPRPMCKNGDKCHVAAPRGSRTGTQGLKNNYERSKLPIDLCKEILTS